MSTWNRFKNSACTSMMVGKHASTDGSTFISRNEDRIKAIEPKRFLVRPAVKNRQAAYVSAYNQLTVPLPADSMRYTATPSVDQTQGPNEEDGFNEAGVGESATESVYANPKVLAYDPYVKNGLAEDSLTTLVLPYIHSAHEGVDYLGRLIAKYGSAEGNGIQFIDQDEVWYMEIATGHYWVAVRIPDDCYAVAANQIAIEDIDFGDSQNFAWADGIRPFVEKNHLNPDDERWNFRHIFGTNTKQDHHYNTPRVWFAQHYLSPSLTKDQTPESADMPFIRKPDHKISVEDIQYVLKSHYNETPYDPLGSGTLEQRRRYRSIALSRTAQSHILQARNDSYGAAQAIQWVEFGVPTFCAYVPFFANADDTDASYREFPEKMDLNNAYWLNEALASVVESHYAKFAKDNLDFQDELQAWARRKIKAVDDQISQLDGQRLTSYLTSQNHDIAKHFNTRAQQHLFDLLTKGAELSKLTFKMDPNL